MHFATWCSSSFNLFTKNLLTYPFLSVSLKNLNFEINIFFFHTSPQNYIRKRATGQDLCVLSFASSFDYNYMQKQQKP